MKAYMYILQCSDGQYYTGSTKDLERRLEEHQLGMGANFTHKLLPLKLIYVEEFERVEDAFFREKQVQGWSRKKKEAQISRKIGVLHELARCKNKTSSEFWRRHNHPSTSLRDRNSEYCM